MHDRQRLLGQRAGRQQVLGRGALHTGPEDERKAEDERQNLLLRGAREEKAPCPYCGERYSDGVLLGHYEKRHASAKGIGLSESRSTSAGREPNNGMHPTRDTTTLKFLQRLGQAGDVGC